MTYQVSRNGQLYGPYTLEDLQRYVASGNILGTDMAKSEDMPDWLPVAQILGTAGTAGTAGTPGYTGTPGAAIPTPAYAAPSTYPQPSGIAYPDPPNLNWGLELLLGFLTCGFFVVVWNLIIATWANRVQPASKALMFYIAATVMIVLNLGSSWTVVISLSHHVHPHHSVLGNLISLATWVVRLIARFTLRDTLEQHFNGPEPLGLRLNAVMTFFFGGIYFQYKLNEINQMKQALRYRNATR
jgi:GYF domain 2